MMKRNIVIMIAVAAVVIGYFVGRMHYKNMMKASPTPPTAAGEDVPVIATSESSGTTVVETSTVN